MEPTTTILLACGTVLLLASWIQLIIAAAGEDFTWGLCAFFLPPLAYLYALFNWEHGGDSIKLAALGLLLVGLAL